MMRGFFVYTESLLRAPAHEFAQHMHMKIQDRWSLGAPQASYE